MINTFVDNRLYFYYYSVQSELLVHVTWVNEPPPVNVVELNDNHPGISFSFVSATPPVISTSLIF